MNCFRGKLTLSGKNSIAEQIYINIQSVTYIIYKSMVHR